MTRLARFVVRVPRNEATDGGRTLSPDPDYAACRRAIDYSLGGAAWGVDVVGAGTACTTGTSITFG